MVSRFDLFVQTLRVIIKRYSSRYDIILYTFRLFSILLESIVYSTVYIFVLSPTNLVILASLFSFFIKGIFLFSRGILYMLSVG